MEVSACRYSGLFSSGISSETAITGLIVTRSFSNRFSACFAIFSAVNLIRANSSGFGTPVVQSMSSNDGEVNPVAAIISQEQLQYTIEKAGFEITFS